MTQSDGVHPTPTEVRSVLGRAKHDTEAYLVALTRAAVGLGKSPSVAAEMDYLALISDAHRDLVVHLEASFTTLGLPYERVIDANCEEILDVG